MSDRENGLVFASPREMNVTAIKPSAIATMSAEELRAALRALIAPACAAALERGGHEAKPVEGFGPSPCEDDFDDLSASELRAYLRELLSAAPPLN